MSVKHFMAKKVITVELDTTVKRIKEIFHDLAIHHVIVIEGDEIKGIISDRDVLRCISPYIGTVSENERDSYTINKKAHQIMSRHVIKIDQDTPIREAAKLMLAKHVGCLPVTDYRGTLVGILSWKDILGAIAGEDSK